MRLLCTLVFIAALGCGSSDVSRQLGARCSTMADCDERCLVPDDGFGWPGGFCTVSCADDADCPNGSVCSSLEGGVCLFACNDDGDCAFLGDAWTCSGVPEPGQESGESRLLACIGVGE